MLELQPAVMSRFTIPMNRMREAADETFHIRMLGGFRLSVGDYVVDETTLRLQKAKSLIKLLALAPGHRLGREQALDLLWPDLDPDAAANCFHQTLHAARRALAPGWAGDAPTAILRLQNGILALQPPGPLVVDVEEFEAAAAAAMRTQDPTAYEAAVARYTGDLLPDDRYDDWAINRRETLHETYHALLMHLAQLHEARDAWQLAIAALRMVIAGEPAHEEAHAGLMRLYARSGQRHQALRQYALLQAALQRELEVPPQAASQALYQEILTGRFPTDAPSPVAVPTAHPAAREAHNLPTPLTPLIGRAAERRAVAEALAATRLLTLTGAGGCGKTRLALAVAMELASDYPDGVRLVELAALADPALVPRAVAMAVGVEANKRCPLTERLIATLQPRTTLLVLDNCEHLVDACAALVEALLASCPRLRVLVTSRETLRLAGETTWRVPSLALPDPRQAPSHEEVGRAEAAQLFVERARLRQPTFALTPENAPAVAEICRRLDGIPLAIELAAARVPTLTVEQLAARLDDALELLVSGRRTAIPRHQTLRATLDWSYGLLTDQERAALRALATFADGFDLEAAEAVCAGDDRDRRGVLALLEQLVDKSLVLVAEYAGEARYRLLETIRQYAHAQLIASGEANGLRERHAAHYLALAEAAEPALLGPAQVAWFDRLEREHANLRRALHWFSERGDAERGLRIGYALRRFWSVRGHQTEGRAWLTNFLGQQESVARRSRLRIKTLFGAGRLAYEQGDFTATQERSEEMLTLADALGDRTWRAFALTQLGHVAVERRDYDAARALYEEGLAIRREGEDARTLGISLTSLAGVALRQGDAAAAHMHAAESLTIFRQVGDKLEIARALAMLGRTSLERGDRDAARALLEESLSWWHQVGDRLGTIRSLVWLAQVVALQGDDRLAGGLFIEATLLARERGAKPWIAQGLAGVACIAAARQPARALRLRQAAMAMQTGNDAPAAAWLRRLVHTFGTSEASAGDAAHLALSVDEAIAEAQRLAEDLPSSTPVAYRRAG